MELQQVHTVELGGAGSRLLEAEQRPAKRRLAATGLADQAEDLAAPDVEGHVVDGPDVADDPAKDPGPDRVVGLEVLDRDEDPALTGRGGRTERFARRLGIGLGLGERRRVGGLGRRVLHRVAARVGLQGHA